MEESEFPPHIREAMAARDAVTQPVTAAVEARHLFDSYYAEVGDLLRWLRKALVDINQVAYSRPLKSWSSTPDLWDAQTDRSIPEKPPPI
jgi:hypothetical protein